MLGLKRNKEPVPAGFCGQPPGEPRVGAKPASCLGSSPRPQLGGDGSLLPIFLCLLGPGCKWLPHGANCHLASRGWGSVLTTCHRRVNFKLSLKRKRGGRWKPASSCYKAGVALFTPPLARSSRYSSVCSLCGPGEGAERSLCGIPTAGGAGAFPWELRRLKRLKSWLEGVFQGRRSVK